jgi:perosamine synthetase
MEIKEKISISEPHLPKDVIDAATQQLESGQIGRSAKVVSDFENKFAINFGYKHAIAVNSCTSALRMAYALAGISIKDEVITTPNTFVATNTTILEQNAIPIFADVQYGTGNIDPNTIEERIGKRTKAIIIVHYMGYPCDLGEIYKIANDHNLVVIEDCAHAIGVKTIALGSFGCFSFQVVKHITTGDGGMFVTDNDTIAERAKRMAWFGMRNRYPDDIIELGYKYQMNAIAAAMGLAQLKYVDELIHERRLKAKVYFEELMGTKDLTLMDYSDILASSYYMFPIHVERRNQFIKHMIGHNIEAFIHNYRNDQYSIFGGKQNLPNMAKLDEDLICLPIHHKVDLELLDYIIRTIKRGW